MQKQTYRLLKIIKLCTYTSRHHLFSAQFQISEYVSFCMQDNFLSTLDISCSCCPRKILTTCSINSTQSSCKSLCYFTILVLWRLFHKVDTPLRLRFSMLDSGHLVMLLWPHHCLLHLSCSSVYILKVVTVCTHLFLFLF